jgi:hypothetical protein
MPNRYTEPLLSYLLQEVLLLIQPVSYPFSVIFFCIRRPEDDLCLNVQACYARSLGPEENRTMNYFPRVRGSLFTATTSLSAGSAQAFFTQIQAGLLIMSLYSYYLTES